MKQRERSIHKEYIQWIEPDTPYSEAKSRKILNDKNTPYLEDYLKIADTYDVWCKKNNVTPRKQIKGVIMPKNSGENKTIQLCDCYICGEYYTNFDAYIKDLEKHFLEGDWAKAMVNDSHEQQHYIYNYRVMTGKFRNCS